MLAINLDISNVILKDRRNVDLREGSFTKDNEEARLSAGAITNDDEFATKLSHDAAIGVVVEATWSSRRRAS